MTTAIGIAVILIAAAAGLALLALGFPGTLLILAMTAIFALATGMELISWTAILVMAGLMVAAEGIEFLLGYWGAKRYGSSRKAAVASIVGGVLGGIVGAIFGAGLLSPVTSLIGVFAGAFAGAYGAALSERRAERDARRIGWGALTGRVLGLAAKIGFALAMIVTAFVSLLFY